MFLLDECLSPEFATNFDPLESATVAAQGWLGLADDEILRRSRGLFLAIITLDRRFARGSELAPADPTIVILRPRRDRIDFLVALLPKLEATLANLQPGTIIEVCW